MTLFQTLGEMFSPNVDAVNIIDSQNRKILMSLLDGNKLTSIDILQKFNSFRASARIFDLRKAGWNIKTEIIKTKTKKHIALYSLVKDEE